MEKAILVGLDLPQNTYDINYSLEELKNLAKANEIEVIDIISQKLDKPTSKYFIGSGKVNEVKQAINFHEANLVIFDDELSPSQLKHLEEYLDVKVIDRSYLILEIFAKRAKTTESILEIKLAKNKYMLPRLSGMRDDLSRQGGTSGSLSSKGAGETKLELDRRYISNEIVRLEKQLADIRKMKTKQAKRRKANHIPIIALTGYTNAGKSTTMNTLLEYANIKSEKQVLEKNQLFATLQTFTRQLSFNKTKFLLVDTIGFVSKLPHHLVNSFKSTLEEIKEADLIIHVLDASSNYVGEQEAITTSILHSLGCSDIPTLYLLNKSDLIDEQLVIHGHDSLPFSNKTKMNLNALVEYLTNKIHSDLESIDVFIPYTSGSVINFIEENTIVTYKVHEDAGINYGLKVHPKDLVKLEQYFINSSIN